jgi:hypothetical protein
VEDQYVFIEITAISVSAPLEFLKRNHGRKLREVMDAEIDISDVIQ